MNVVTVGAGKTGVLALELPEFDDLLRMTRDTLVGYVFGQLGGFRGVRVAVTTLTVGQFVMWLAAVTLRTQRDNVFNCWRMAVMTILTGNVSLVCASIGGDVGSRGGMALHAVRITENRVLLMLRHRHRHRPGAKGDGIKSRHQYRCQKQPFCMRYHIHHRSSLQQE
jgi:hypothetical protein